MEGGVSAEAPTTLAVDEHQARSNGPLWRLLGQPKQALREITGNLGVVHGSGESPAVRVLRSREGEVQRGVQSPPVPHGAESGARALVAAVVEEGPDRVIELVGNLDVADMTGVRQHDEP
jgi:hypothetical protein